MSETDLTFDAAIRAMNNGAHASLTGREFTVNGITLAITDEQFDIAWDAMNDGLEDIPPDALISLNDAVLSPVADTQQEQPHEHS